MEDSRFLVGATTDKVFTADTEVRAYALDSGKELWSYPAAPASLALEGQPVLAGNQVLLSTKDTFHVVDGNTGKAQTEKVDPKIGPLGNLVPLPGMLLGINDRFFGAQKLAK
jgi:outer membrane protein assembly factor BamB